MKIKTFLFGPFRFALSSLLHVWAKWSQETEEWIGYQFALADGLDLLMFEEYMRRKRIEILRKVG